MLVINGVEVKTMGFKESVVVDMERVVDDRQRAGNLGLVMANEMKKRSRDELVRHNMNLVRSAQEFCGQKNEVVRAAKLVLGALKPVYGPDEAEGEETQYILGREPVEGLQAVVNVSTTWDGPDDRE